MRIRLPFTGTLLKSYEPGTVPTFDPNDPMRPIDDVVGEHGYRVLIGTFDFERGTVEIEVRVEPLMKMRLPDNSEVWSDAIPSLPAGSKLDIIGEQSESEFNMRVLAEESKIASRVEGKTDTDLRSESSRVDNGFIDARLKPRLT